MKTLARLFSLVALGVGSGGLGVPPTAFAKSPVVVELFTAQGCASCKQANRLIARLAGRPGVIALTWSVDYWDYLGWKDTFAQPIFTTRQKTYAKRLGPRDVYTPQVVVGGAAQVSGDDAAAVEALVRAAERPRRGHPLRVRLTSGGWVSVGAAVRPPLGVDARARADIWLVRYDPQEQAVRVTAGDNRGASVVHRNVVRELVRLGSWSGRAESLKAPPTSEAGLATAIIVQAAHGGPIIAAADSPAVPAAAGPIAAKPGAKPQSVPSAPVERRPS